jgi:actin-related protein 5
LKAGFDARVRAKREKEREREEKEIEERRDLEEREADLAGWASRMRKEHEVYALSTPLLVLHLSEYVSQVLMNRVKERTRRKAALSDRKSAASQARMKSIASLAADDRMSKKKRKAGSGKFLSLSELRRR